jgi:hypothetical protein
VIYADGTFSYLSSAIGNWNDIQLICNLLTWEDKVKPMDGALFTKMVNGMGLKMQQQR